MTTFQFPPPNITPPGVTYGAPLPQIPGISFPPVIHGAGGDYGAGLPSYGAPSAGPAPAAAAQAAAPAQAAASAPAQAAAAPAAPSAQAAKSLSFRLGQTLGGGIRSLGTMLGNFSQLGKASITGRSMGDIASGAGLGPTGTKILSRGGRLGAAALLGYGAYKGGRSLYEAMSDEGSPTSQAGGAQLTKEEAQMRQKVSDTVLRGLKFDDQTKFSKTDMQALLRGQPASVKSLYDNLRKSTAIEGKKYSQFDRDVYDAARGEKSVLDIYNAMKRASMGGEGSEKLPDVIYLPRRYKLGESGKEYMVAIDAKTEKGKPRMVYMAIDDNKLSFEKPE